MELGSRPLKWGIRLSIMTGSTGIGINFGTKFVPLEQILLQVINKYFVDENHREKIPKRNKKTRRRKNNTEKGDDSHTSLCLHSVVSCTNSLVN